MKRTQLIILLIYIFSYILSAQDSLLYKPIRLPDSTAIVFHNIPLVQIEYHDINPMSSFDYKNTYSSLLNIQEILAEMGYIIPTNPDYNTIERNSEFVELMRSKNSYISDINSFLNELSQNYAEKYICFICQYGFTSSELLLKAKREGDSRPVGNIYEHFYFNGSYLILIIFDRVENQIVYLNSCSTHDKNNDYIFSKELNNKLFLKLKKKLLKQINRNLRQKRHSF